VAADAWGIDEGYEDALGAWRATAPVTRRAILAAMGVTDDAAAPPRAGGVRVLRAGGRGAPVPPGELVLEDGTALRVGGALPADLPPGYHDLHPEGGGPVRLVVAPPACFLPQGLREWGLTVQLYALRSAASWGIGDAGDLRELARWSAGALGGRLVLISPLGAGTPVIPLEPSPYFPSSRRYRDPLYLRVEEVPGAAARALNGERRIDRDAVLGLKLDALGRLFAAFAGDAAFESHRAGAVVVGEDLGTVEAGVRERLAAERVLSCRVLWLEETAPAGFPALALASVTTHDLPTIAGLWTGSDVREQRALGLAPNEEALGAIRGRLRVLTGAPEGAPVGEVVRRTHRLLADAPSVMITATLEDVLGLAERPNMPGTTAAVRPNWSVALPLPLEALRNDPRPRAVAEALGGRPVMQEIDG